MQTIQVPTTVRTTRLLALGTIAGPVLFTVAWFVLGFLSPGYEIEGDWISPYSPISQPISGLGLGRTGPYMNTALIVSGLVTVAGLVGVFRSMRAWASAAALALSPLGLVVAGIFTIEHDLPHFIGFGLIAMTPIVTFPAVGLYLRRVPAWRTFGTYLIAGGLLTLLATAGYLASFDETTTADGRGVAGLTSRLLVLEIHAWYVALGWLALRRAR
jgi:hypothetical membrane protein